MLKSFVLLICVIFSNFSLSQEQIMNVTDFPKDKKSFLDAVGEEYVAKKESKFLFKNGKQINANETVKAFLTSPNSAACTSNDNCLRKSLTNSSMKFKVINIISGVTSASYPCEKHINSCYYKLQFEDGDLAYMQIMDFSDASEPIRAKVFKQPAILQIIPINPDKFWLYTKKDYDKFFKKMGVREGYSQEEVLNSSWGKPLSKTHSKSAGYEIDIWIYSGGMLGFENGYLTTTTTSD